MRGHGLLHTVTHEQTQEFLLKTARESIWNLMYYAKTTEEIEKYKKILDSVLQSSYDCGIMHVK